MKKWVWILLILSACQPVKDNTGRMGEVVERTSPAEIYVQLAREYLRLGDYQSALIKAKKAVNKDDDYANAHLIMALIYEKLGENELANRSFQNALKIEPKNSYVLNAYGSYLCGLEEYERSLDYFKKAVNNPLYPTPWIPLTNAGICAKKAGQLDQAELYLRNALQKKPDFAPALMQMAEVSYEQGHYLSARAYVQRFKEVAEPTAQLLYISIMTEKKLGHEENARLDERLLFSRFPDSDAVKKLNDEYRR